MGQFEDMAARANDTFAKMDATLSKKRAREAAEKGDTSKAEDSKEKGIDDPFAELGSALEQKRDYDKKEAIRTDVLKAKKTKEAGKKVIAKRKIESEELQHKTREEKTTELMELLKGVNIDALAAKLPKRLEAVSKGRVGPARGRAARQVARQIQQKIIEALNLPKHGSYNMGVRLVGWRYEETENGVKAITEISKNGWKKHILAFIEANK